MSESKLQHFAKNMFKIGTPECAIFSAVLAMGLALYYQRAAVAVSTTDYLEVALTLQDQHGTILKNEAFATQYEATEA